MDIRLEFAKLEDYKHIEKLAQIVHKEHVKYRSDIYINSDYIFTLDRYKQVIKDQYILIAKDFNFVYGYVYFYSKITSIPILQERKVLFIDTIVVDTGYRKQGIGHMLLEYVIQYAKKNNYNSIELSVLMQNTNAINFYSNKGFKEKMHTMEFIV